MDNEVPPLAVGLVRRALSLSPPPRRHLRDALAARQHVSVSEVHYETAGRKLLQSRKAAVWVE